MNPIADDQFLNIESRPERRGRLAVPEAVTTRRDIVATALANLSSAVNAGVEHSHMEEGPVQADNRRLAEIIENTQGVRPDIDDTQAEIHGGDGSDLTELRRKVAAAYPSDVEHGGSY